MEPEDVLCDVLEFCLELLAWTDVDGHTEKLAEELRVGVADLLWDSEDSLDDALDVNNLLVHLLRICKQVKQLLTISTKQHLKGLTILHQ